MRRATYAALAAASVLSSLHGAQSPPTLFTAPQRDRLRSATTPPSASVSADGTLIAFASYERLVPEDQDTSADIYVVDRTTARATLESVGADDLPIASDCTSPRISGDGRFILFETAVAAADGSRITVDIILRDRAAKTIRRISRSVSGGQPNARSADPALSADGSTAVFASIATDLVPGPDANGTQSDIYSHHLPTGVTRRVSVTDAGVQLSQGSNIMPSISADGRYVAFNSTADLAPSGSRDSGAREPRSVTMQAYVRDTVLGRTFRVAPRGKTPNGPSSGAVISQDGRYVVFASFASNLVPDDRNRSRDVFLFDRAQETITLVSRGVGGRSANGASGNASISADGRLVAFQSAASDLTCASSCGEIDEDVNLLHDVFVFDRRSGTITRVSEGADGGWMEESGAPALDSTGAIVAFTSKHPTDARDVANDFDLFVSVAPDRR